MALTAIDIFKSLPKTNCGDCGMPTCLAFAMALAQKRAELSSCPHVSDEAKNALEASSAPPIRLVTLGTGENRVQQGNETELFRHDKKFFHQTSYGLILNDNLSDDELKEKLALVDETEAERVGLPLTMEIICLKNGSGDGDNFAQKVKLITSITKRPLVLVSTKPDVLRAGAKVSGGKALLHAADSGNWEEMSAIASETDCSLVVRADTIDILADLTGKIKAKGVEDMVLDMDFGNQKASKTMQDLTILRRLALKKNFRPLGYPTIMFQNGNDYGGALIGVLGTLKYASFILFEDIASWKMYPLFTLRQNIFTDPQKPIQVQPDIYPLGNPGPDAPLILTCNFSLTYFSVKGDVERSKVPANILVVDSDGLSVLTAYAAEKMTPATMAEALMDPKYAEATKNKEVIIPGLIARARAKLMELTGFNVIVGPKDSSGLPKFLKNM